MRTTEKMNDNVLMYERIATHGENLKKLFGLPIDTDPIKLCKQLRQLEAQATVLTTKDCNEGTDSTADLVRISRKAKLLLMPNPDTIDPLLWKAVFINGDPRGYALKIDDTYVRETGNNIYRDMGGYGIIAPDLSI